MPPDPYSSSILRVNGNLITSLKFGGSGIFRSSDDGVNWIDWSEGLPFLKSIEKLIVYEDKIIAATSDGLWQRDTSGVITAWEEYNNLPHEFKLEQNFPNPFNPTTVISWQSPGSNNQTLKVYDMLGRELATLVDEYKPAGSYEIEFDASDLSTGIYFYQLNSGNFIQTKKMILLR